MNTVGALLLGSVTDRGLETDDGRLGLLGTGSDNGTVNGSKIAGRKSNIENMNEKPSRTGHRH